MMSASALKSNTSPDFCCGEFNFEHLFSKDLFTARCEESNFGILFSTVLLIICCGESNFKISFSPVLFIVL